jgi:hypothetical protein
VLQSEERKPGRYNNNGGSHAWAVIFSQERCMRDEPGPQRGSSDRMEWAEAMPEEQAQVFRHITEAAQVRGLRFAMGGAFAVAVHTGHWRNTKDLDYYVLPQDRPAMVEVVHEAGLTDYFEAESYDRAWIYRANQGETIVDVIWAMANGRADVDEGWVTRGELVEAQGLQFRVVPAEEMIWAKLFVFQRERFDWPDVLNMIHGAGKSLDWEHLLTRLGHDVPLLAGVLSVYAWLAPGAAQRLPDWLWQRLSVEPPAGQAPAVDQERVKLLDSRPWFGRERAGDGI